MSENSNGWETLYNEAVAELDPIKLQQKIKAARSAIVDRVSKSLHGRNPIDAIEQQAIEGALCNLYFLKKHPAA